ncbi:hypothetical protein Q5762_22405 [Streptomyces sp. P9(2023)]|uniref:hypothetical protein n=1 Tax=Streptomyces sp. P9(2023) TaxID=3064394 RepID=UPI0028F3EB82|nr:hypothetical protein [Streptomyces sp. P9(2023)]MDT9691049.1 hypothetical protein [Streptomyces sp. P9(2023)]
MSISVGLSLDVSGLQPGEETARVTEALNEFLIKHDLERDVVVGRGASPEEVSAWSEYPIIVTRFGAWADRIEQAAHDTVRAVAPAARVDLRWSFEDEDD